MTARQCASPLCAPASGGGGGSPTPRALQHRVPDQAPTPVHFSAGWTIRFPTPCAPCAVQHAVEGLRFVSHPCVLQYRVEGQVFVVIRVFFLRFFCGFFCGLRVRRKVVASRATATGRTGDCPGPQRKATQEPQECRRQRPIRPQRPGAPGEGKHRRLHGPWAPSQTPPHPPPPPAPPDPQPFFHTVECHCLNGPPYPRVIFTVQPPVTERYRLLLGAHRALCEKPAVFHPR